MMPESLPMLLLCPRLSSKQLTLPSAKLVSDSAKENILKYWKNISENKRILAAHLYSTQYMQFSASGEGTPKQGWIKGKSFTQANLNTFRSGRAAAGNDSNSHYLPTVTPNRRVNVNSCTFVVWIMYLTCTHKFCLLERISKLNSGF